MEPTAEGLALLREIPDGQRELIELTRTAIEWSQRLRLEAREEWKGALTEQAERGARQDTVNRLWLESVHRQWRFAVLLLILLLGSALITGIGAALGWCR